MQYVECEVRIMELTAVNIVVSNQIIQECTAPLNLGKKLYGESIRYLGQKTSKYLTKIQKNNKRNFKQSN